MARTRLDSDAPSIVPDSDADRQARIDKLFGFIESKKRGDQTVRQFRGAPVKARATDGGLAQDSVDKIESRRLSVREFLGFVGLAVAAASTIVLVLFGAL